MHILHWYYYYLIILSVVRLIQGFNCGDLRVRLAGGVYSEEGVVEVCQRDDCGYLCLDNFTRSHEVKHPLLSEKCSAIERNEWRNSSGYDVSFADDETNYVEVSSCEGNATLSRLNSCEQVAAVYCKLSTGSGKRYQAEEVTSTTHMWGQWTDCMELGHQPIQFNSSVDTKSAYLTWTASKFQGTEIETGCPSVTLDMQDAAAEANRILKKSEARNFTVLVNDGRENGTDDTCVEYALGKHDNKINYNKYTLCIAQKNGSYFVLPCNRYLPMLCKEVRSERKDTPTTTNSTTTGGQTRYSNMYLPEKDGLGEIDIIWIILGILLGLITIVIIQQLVSHFKSRRHYDGQIRNSVVNRTYTGQENVTYERVTYEVLPDIEPGVITPPPLPPREVRLEDYGSPSDGLLLKSVSNENVVEYSLTFDDTRRKRSNSEGALKPDSSFCERLSASKSLSVFDEENMKSSSDKCMVSCEDETLDIRKRFKISDTGSVDDNFLLPKAQKISVSEDSDYEDATIFDGNFKNNNLLKTGCTHNHGDPKKGSASDSDSEYEDTTVFDENSKHKSKPRLFEQHVCLECIPDDILKKLGIRIVRADDTYYYSRYSDGLQKRPLMIKSYENIDCSASDDNEDNSKPACQHDGRTYKVDSKLNERFVVNGEYDKICNVVKLLNKGDFLNVYDHISNISRMTTGAKRKQRVNSV